MSGDIAYETSFFRISTWGAEGERSGSGEERENGMTEDASASSVAFYCCCLLLLLPFTAVVLWRQSRIGDGGGSSWAH